MSDDPVVETINAILNGEDNFILLLQRPQLERIRDEIVALRGARPLPNGIPLSIGCVSDGECRASPCICVQSAFASAREQALEEAAQRCDRLGTDYTIPVSADHWSAGCRGCADRIRALKGKSWMTGGSF